MRYNDISFLQDLKDYLVYDILKVNIYINNKIEYVCYNFDIMNYIDYDELNISILMFKDGISLNLYFTKKEGDENE